MDVLSLKNTTMKKMGGTEKKRGGEERIEKKKIERAKERVKNFECM